MIHFAYFKTSGNQQLTNLLQSSFGDAIAGNAKIGKTVINFMEQLHKSSLFSSFIRQDIG